ncbi:hypothetical protein G5I_08454 [Acromyrmex echinatior]|uniref:Uncharacterized protein n=1 Tax=Acromyrmex echinatior TaxID=103372 RepID=F4WRK2_ACREC|nr:hypothetical protein G5I_08454 [Acromyrmex echinatior]
MAVVVMTPTVGFNQTVNITQSRYNLQQKSDRQIFIEISVDLPIFVVRVVRLRITPEDGAAIDGLREPSANGSTDDLSRRYYQSYHVRTHRMLGITGNDFHGVSPAKDGINMASRSASVTFRMVNGIVAPATSNRRARRRSKRSSKPSFPSMERGLVGVTMTGCDPDSIEESR